MPFQQPVPVAKLLKDVHNSEYVLPAIQREFVWDTDQICKLFDSLMRGYPIGSFLFWKVSPEEAVKYTFYDFITDYHEKNNPHAPTKQIPPGDSAIAILDGQQRITALNIGLYGSHSERLPYKHATTPDAYPKKQLYLDLLGAPSEDDNLFKFKFLTQEEASLSEDKKAAWFRVSEILSCEDSGPSLVKIVAERELDPVASFNLLYKLYEAINTTCSINSFLEEEQDADRVLDIFVRVNSGGTELSNSDLLLSMATNQWGTIDARQAVRELVEEINSDHHFAFSKDLVLKAGLMLTDVPDVGFKVSNFTQVNMANMESAWPEIHKALFASAMLLKDFGYTDKTLSANSVVIPVAYYVYLRRLDQKYLNQTAHADDRNLVRNWVARSLMKRGIWSSGLDSLLSSLRSTIKEHGKDGFPSDAIEASMMSLGKSINFNEDEVNELLDIQYKNKRVFPVLAALYPGLDFTNIFHIDHIFPRSHFTKSKLTAAGVPAESIADCMDKKDGLANLQLLKGPANLAKQAVLPSEWLNGDYFISNDARDQYMNDNDLQSVPEDVTGFLDFYDKRRQALEKRLLKKLGVVSSGLAT